MPGQAGMVSNAPINWKHRKFPARKSRLPIYLIGANEVCQSGNREERHPSLLKISITTD